MKYEKMNRNILEEYQEVLKRHGSTREDIQKQQQAPARIKQIEDECWNQETYKKFRGRKWPVLLDDAKNMTNFKGMIQPQIRKYLMETDPEYRKLADISKADSFKEICREAGEIFMNYRKEYELQGAFSIHQKNQNYIEQEIQNYLEYGKLTDNPNLVAENGYFDGCFWDLDDFYPYFDDYPAPAFTLEEAISGFLEDPARLADAAFTYGDLDLERISETFFQLVEEEFTNLFGFENLPDNVWDWLPLSDDVTDDVVHYTEKNWDKNKIEHFLMKRPDTSEAFKSLSLEKSILSRFEQSVPYARFVTHLQYLFQRAHDICSREPMTINF